jgi:DNA-binding MarR family transcriptional regulator
VERGFPDIRPAHGAVFRYIAEEGSRVSDLADRAGMTKQSMAYLVAYLEEHGYVTLVPDARDGRAKLARVTDRGAAVQAAAAALSREVEGEWAHALGGESMAALRDPHQS